MTISGNLRGIEGSTRIVEIITKTGKNNVPSDNSQSMSPIEIKICQNNNMCCKTEKIKETRNADQRNNFSGAVLGECNNYEITAAPLNVNVSIKGGDGWWVEYLRIKTEQQVFDCPHKGWLDDSYLDGYPKSIFLTCQGRFEKKV